MSHTSLAKETLLHFMQEMYSWERKACRSLRSKSYKEMLKNELSAIFDQFCTSKKTLRTREVSLSVRFPFEYKLETHHIIDEGNERNQTYFYIKEEHAGLENLYRFRMIFQKEEWRIDKKEWLCDGKWINSSL